MCDSFCTGDLLTKAPISTLIYVDAEARMDSYQAADGSNQTRLNLVQSETYLYQVLPSINIC